MITAIGDVMRECYKRGWITTRDGNVSLRQEGAGKIHITPTAVRKYLIYPEIIDNLYICDGHLKLDGGAAPSGELQMHWLLLKDIPETRCVLHVHPTNIVAAMFAGWSLPAAAEAFPEVYRYTRVGPNVPSLPAISQELAEATAAAFAIDNGIVEYDVVGQANHGACAVGSSPWDAFEHIERLEHICQIVLNSGITPKEL